MHIITQTDYHTITIDHSIKNKRKQSLQRKREAGSKPDEIDWKKREKKKRKKHYIEYLHWLIKFWGIVLVV